MKEFKGVWHKVADGDLPELEELVLIAFKDGGLGTTIGYLKEYNIYKTWQIQDKIIGTRKGWATIDYETFGFNEVVAWMELPEYEEEQKLFLNSKSYKVDNDKLQTVIFYQNRGEWKLCCKGEGFSDAVSIEFDKVILNIKNLEFDSEFAKSHDITDKWDRGFRFKVLFKGMSTSIDGKHPIDILCNNCEILYKENNSLVLEALHDENGEKMQLIIEDNDNYKKITALSGESK